jgi:hypothetical protein
MQARRLLSLLAVVAWGAGCSADPTEASDSSAYELETAGQMAATSAHVVSGRVADVEQGAEIHYRDGSGAVITPRVLVFEVEEYLFTRDTESETPSTLRVQDGYWENGRLHGQEGVDAAEPGDTAVLFLRRDRAGDGSLMSTYSPLGSEGRVLFDSGDVEYDASQESVWASLGEDASPAVLEGAIAEAVEQAESGAARPVRVEVCWPSVPGDEDSEPICERL